MSSIPEASSTNDMSSTMGTSMTSFTSTARLTADAIIKECIRHGYYRNPICNEVLYLHHKGFDSIDPVAFDRYVDVKVLWLEGNGFSSIACGGKYVQVKPPKMDKLFDSDEEEEEEEEEETKNKAEEQERTAPTSREKSHHVDPFAPVPEEPELKPQKSPRYPALPLPDIATVDPENKDVFSSLYRTVRQLYLHNNVFREMPDLSRFQRLDSLNLSNNFFPTIRPCCSHWDTCMQAHLAAEEEALASSKSAMRERARAMAQVTGGTDDPNLPPPLTVSTITTAGSERHTDEDIVRVVPSEEARVQREAQLKKYASLLDKFSGFCPHEPLPQELCGKKWRAIPPDQRSPCCSLRSLNLAGNHIETFEDLCGLLCYKSVAVLDLSNNQIKDGEMLLLILERMEHLSSLKLSGNPMVRTLRRYRKTVVARCRRLLHLDDRPVFEEERRMVNAWAVGGEAGEERERLAIKQEKEAKEKKRLEDFRRLIARSQRHATEGGPHEAYIGAITTREAVAAVAREEADAGASSATSSETEESEEDNDHHVSRMPADGVIRPPTATLAAQQRRLEQEVIDDDEEDDEPIYVASAN